MNKWNHIITQVDNWIWLFLAIIVCLVAKYCEVPELNGIALVCIVKIREVDGAIKKNEF